MKNCPACKSSAIVASQVATVVIKFNQLEDGRWRRRYGGDLHPEPWYIEYQCDDCGHTWRARGVKASGYFETETVECGRELDVKSLVPGGDADFKVPN